MIEIEKKVKTENITQRRRDRFFSPVITDNAEVIETKVVTKEEPKQTLFDVVNSSTTNVSKDLTKFDNYKATDLSEIFNNINIKTNVQKTQQKKVTETIKEDLNEDFLNVTKLSTDIAEATYKVAAPAQYVEKNVGLKINLKGKLIIMVASVILLCLAFLAIYNAVAIGNLNKSIDSLDKQIIQEERVLNYLEDAYNTLTSEEVLKQIASENGLKPMDPGDVISYTPANPVGNRNDSRKTNWFDALASFFAKLLGAN